MAKELSRKPSVVVVFTGDGKGKTSAAIGLCCRALGAGQKVAFVQFIKNWEVSEHKFFAKIEAVYNCHPRLVWGSVAKKIPQQVRDDRDEVFVFYKGGKGFYNLGKHSAKNISTAEHKTAARETLKFAKACATSGDFDLVICDEINNAVADKLISRKDLEDLIVSRNARTSLCLTGRNFPPELLKFVDIATEMTKIKHHYDDGFLAVEGIDF